MHEFRDTDYWKAIIGYGLNSATYKIALGSILLDFAQNNVNSVPWHVLSKSFLDAYSRRIEMGNAMPQQANPARLTIMERIITEKREGRLTNDQAIDEVGKNAFHDVIPRFHSIGKDKLLLKDKFYEASFGKALILKDPLFEVCRENIEKPRDELMARWGLLEAAFEIHRTQSALSNDQRLIYLRNGYDRTNITGLVPFLSMYQGRRCFYCGEEMQANDIHVDHLLPRQVIYHDEIWNLVLAHEFCNESKSDKLVGSCYITKLIQRNENIMGSSHPWKQKIEEQLGKSARERGRSLQLHYDNVKDILGNYYWGGVATYTPEKDLFYKNLITRLNNG